MLQAKFQNRRPSGSGKKELKDFAIYNHGGHLDHVTLTIHIILYSPFLRMLHTKFGFDLPRGIREEHL